MKNKITDLRNHLFAALEGLADPENPLDIDRARAISDVAKVVIDSARVEVDFVKATGAITGTDFFPDGEMAALPQRKPEAIRN